MMRYLLTICFLFTLSVSSPAQKTDTDSTKKLTLKELELSNEQLMAIKKLVVEYKSEERIKRSKNNYPFPPATHAQ